MTFMIKTLTLGAGFAALAAVTPANAQYYPPYGNAYGYQANTTNVLAQRCAAAVQQRLSVRGNRGILSSLLGVNTYNNARVLSVTQVTPRRETVRVRGIASSGRLAHNPYGAGAWGMLGSAYAQPVADLRFNCTVDYRGFIRDVDINRR
jgi:hypothetical protein